MGLKLYLLIFDFVPIAGVLYCDKYCRQNVRQKVCQKISVIITNTSELSLGFAVFKTKQEFKCQNELFF